MNQSDFSENSQVHLSITRFLSESVKSLANYLERILPTISDNWWSETVLDKLSFHQQKQISRRSINSLTSLDLAALLRILDQNWYKISMAMNLSSEERHFVKEMQTIRNRWAHASTDGFSDDDVYRDLDTIQRFLTTISTSEDFIQEIKSAKASLFSERKESTVVEAKEMETVEVEFEVGQIVFLKSDPAIRGAVLSIIHGDHENRYKLFVDNKTQIYYASQLLAEEENDEDISFIPCKEFHSYLTALQIRHPGLSTLYSLNAARVDFIPYQFRPVLKFIQSDRPRLLIADSVGVGKTIEAGLILRELQARRDVRSVLVICPRPLVTERKWLIEMKRFEERFSHLDGRTFRYCINEMDLDGVWPEQYQKAIIPYTLFDDTLLYGTGSKGSKKRRKGLLELDPPPRFDLVIVDEAHHIRNTDTANHKAVRYFCDNAEAVIFLTATPIQLGNDDLFVLLNTLRPDLIIDRESFEHMAEPNPFINQAVNHLRSGEEGWSTTAVEALDNASKTSWGRSILKHNPEFIRVRDKLSQKEIDPDERVELIRDIEAIHTFSGIINRTRRRDIGDFTVRKPVTKYVEFTPAQQTLHDNLLQIQAEIYSRLHDNINVKFMMTTIRRQAASCLYGLAPFLENILKRHLDALSWDEADSSEDTPSEKTVDLIESKIEKLLEEARHLDPSDPKLEQICEILRDKQELPNNKVMIFSSFRHTLSYLHQHLKASGFRIGMVHGGTSDEDRVDLRRNFELPREREDALDVLLFSEIGCEGLDYQFCDCIVNYDLPWNPMRIEQRIGRIDRNGQRSESVAIFNLITPGTVDADIYERCLVRIGVFNRALGGSEEILGEISKGIKNIAESFELNDADRGEKLQQLSDNKIRLIQEQDKLEQKQVELFGIELPVDQFKKDIKNASSFWLTPSAIQNLVTMYLQKRCDKEQEFILGDKPLKTLRLSQESRNRLLKDYHKLPRLNSPPYRDWENWLKGGEPHLQITFDSKCASENSAVAFIMPLHPIVRQASRVFDSMGRVATTLKVKDGTATIGEYPFAIYQWQFHGIRENLVLLPVVVASNEISIRLNELLENAEDDESANANFIEPSVLNELDDHHYKIWVNERELHKERINELVRFRRESLDTSHKARIALLEEQLNLADNEKIQRMRKSQIAAADADYARRLQELDIAVERAELTVQPVAYGILRISKNGENNAI